VLKVRRSKPRRPRAAEPELRKGARVVRPARKRRQTLLPDIFVASTSPSGDGCGRMRRWAGDLFGRSTRGRKRNHETAWRRGADLLSKRLAAFGWKAACNGKLRTSRESRTGKWLRRIDK